MNTLALKRLEISNELSLLPEEDLERVRRFVGSIVGTKSLERKPQSLRGIWRGQGFEEIIDSEKPASAGAVESPGL